MMNDTVTPDPYLDDPTSAFLPCGIDAYEGTTLLYFSLLCIGFGLICFTIGFLVGKTCCRKKTRKRINTDEINDGLENEADSSPASLELNISDPHSSLAPRPPKLSVIERKAMTTALMQSGKLHTGGNMLSEDDKMMDLSLTQLWADESGDVKGMGKKPPGL